MSDQQQQGNDDAGSLQDAAAQRPKRRPPGGKRRNRLEIAALMEKVETAMFHTPSRPDVLKMMSGEGIPDRTVDEYMRKIRERWLSEDLEERPITKGRQKRRLYAQIRKLTVAKDRPDADREIIKRERLLALIEGNLAPTEIDVYEHSKVDELTQEQMQYIADNNGKLPPGVTPAMLNRSRRG